MNIAKNMEAIFVAALVVAVSVSNAFAGPGRAVEVAADNTTVAKVAEVVSTPVATVVVVAKRLSAAEKAKRAA